MGVRNLNADEIAQLEQKGCRSEHWNRVLVGDNFSAEFIENVRFEGDVTITGFTERITESGERTGIYNSCLSNCFTGLNVSITNTGLIKNYHIQDNVLIADTGEISAEPGSCFGNGVEVDVLNEAGGRTVPIFDKLNAQIAYMIVFYRYKKGFTDKILKIINRYTYLKKSDYGTIGQKSRIKRCGIIKNVLVGRNAKITGAADLKNGTVESTEESPSKIGTGVVCKDFIILSGSKVESGAILESSFVGQSVSIGKQYSAENCLIFANSELFHGEGCSIFAGPYTVSHHKSTLLIAGFFSFYNAGSGTNQSNHMYKLGPVHQGILERGSKTGSFSYMLWPSQTGPFTNIIGKHYSHFDTRDLPFSIITEHERKSVLSPAMNLFTVGTKRDSQKWPLRDKRKGEKYDLILFKLFSPFIIERVLRGIKLLQNLQEASERSQELVNYNGTVIKRLLLRPAVKYYEMAIKIFTGQVLIDFILLHNSNNVSLKENLKKRTAESKPVKMWLDIGGMFAARYRIEELIEEVESGEINDLAGLNNKLINIYNSYTDDELLWCLNLIKEVKGWDISSLSTDDVIEILNEWRVNSIKLNNMILRDAEKEYDQASKIGYGRDGDENDKEKDFTIVRGAFEDNSFISAVKKESEEVKNKYNKVVSVLNKLWE